jgi:hypothetical protein
MPSVSDGIIAKYPWYRVTTVQQEPTGPGPIPAGFSLQEVEHLTEAPSLLIGKGFAVLGIEADSSSNARRCHGQVPSIAR